MKAVEVKPQASRKTVARLATVALAIQLATLLSACDEHADVRTGTNAQNTALTQEKKDEIETATGKPTMKNGTPATTYSGTCTMYATNTKYKCELVLSEQLTIQHSTTATSPAETIQVPQLTATLRFPDITKFDPSDYRAYVAGLKKYNDLARATGQVFVVQTTYGDFNKQTNELLLPYTVAGYLPSGNYGEISGTLVNGKFEGEWETALDGKVGRVSVVKQ